MKDVFEQRQAFNFYRSYYEVSLLLDEVNRAEFIQAILHYQFTGEIIEPKNRDASIMFKGQMHSLKKQINGYAKGKETYPNGNPTKGNDKGNDKGSYKEVQGEVQEKEKEEVKKEIVSPPLAKPKSFKQFSKEDFYESIKPFVEKYSNKTCKAFFKYWNEPDPKGKMRFQLEKTWSISHRLSTWKERESKFGTEPVKPINNNVPLGPWNV